jgi:hypothetical protein
MEEKEEEDCSICGFKKQAETTTFVCDHSYCQNCLTKWYFLCVEKHIKPHCPMCRKHDNIWGQ